MPDTRLLVNETYFTLQGEGARTGRHAVFCRFAGCNLWSGHEKDRASAICKICDTDFVGTAGPGGGEFVCPEALADVILAKWPMGQQDPYVVFTGGEPLLQLGEELIAACHKRYFEVAVETNGTIPLPPGIDWICVSPKPGPEWVQQSGDELKLLYPIGIEPLGLETLSFDHFFLQPVDGPNIKENTEAAKQFCRLNHPWQLSLQTHKLMGLP
jgi:7-carboxy-7-deazaguanine synthase (Cx14CxxC type)